MSAGILLAAQSGCSGAYLAGADGSYDTPDVGPFEHAPVQAVTAGGEVPGLTVACQIADSVWQVLDLDTFVPQPQYAFAQTHPADAFVTTWSTTATNQTVTIPVGNSMAAYDIDWGDGATETDAIGDRVHTYLNADTYTVSISGGFDRIHLHGYGDEAAENAGRLASIEQWGDASWSTMQNAFSGTSNMVYRATDAPNLSRVTDMSGMFRDAAAFNGNISSWDVSSVERMEFMFTGATDFDQPLNNWDVSSATNMDAMFSGAAAFDQPLNDWNVSSATSMDAMFSGAAAFNGNISSWDVSSATGMNFMFRNAHFFDQPLSSWDVSSVIAMIGMFWGAHSFDQPLSSWDVSSVIAMDFMFADAAAFNGNISSWDVSSATDMGKMFEGATAFDQDLASWYIILNDTILTSDPASTLTILPLSPYLDPIWQTYSVNDTRFAIDHRTLSLNPEDPPPAGEHPLAVTAPALLSEPNTASHTRIVTIIVLTGPVPNLTTDSPPVTNAASVTVTVDFGKPIDPGTFMLNDISTTDGTASDIAHSSANQKFTFTLAPDADGEVTAVIPADRVTDIADNNNTASNVLRVTFDSTAHDPGAFVTTWRTTATNQMVTIPVGNSTAAYDIDWGDGATETGATGDRVHTYADADTYTVSISGGFDRIYLNSYEGVEAAENAGRLASIEQWGDASWSIMWNAFSGASNMVYRATDAPNLSQVTDMTAMFRDAAAFNGNISSWDVSSVSRMEFMFSGTAFNGDISSWDVSKVTDMTAMFFGATAFNGDISSWDVSKVTTMESMFRGTTAFNGNISSWDVSKVTDMTAMFSGATAFNGDISSWDVSKVTTMESMFRGATASNGDISSWDVSSVTTMFAMFFGATAFNGNISSWDVSKVTTMASMFSGATASNGDISSWDVSKVTDMKYMFFGATAFNGNISSWDVSKVTTMEFMFYSATAFNQPLSSWDVSSVTTMFAMFFDATAFNGNISSWDVSRVTNMEHMFRNAVAFNQPLSTWDVSSATNMEYMFYSTGTAAFDQDLANWYIILSDTTLTAGTLTILPLSPYLDARLQTYSVNDTRFAIDHRTLSLNPEDPPPAGEHPLAVTAPIRLSEPNTASHTRIVTIIVLAGPAPNLTTDSPPVTNAASVTVTVDFGEPIDPDTFTLNDISATDGTASSLAHSSANQTFTFTLTPDADGEVTVEMPAGAVTDPDNILSSASNVLRVTFDRTTHVPALSTDADSPTNAASATVTVDFGEPINPATFDISDVSVSGGDASNLAQEGATTQRYTFTVTPTSDGTITVTIPAGSVTDQANNSITASNVLRVTFDRTTHVPALSTDADSPTNAASATVTVDFGEPINPATFDISDVSVSGGDASNLAQEGATTQRYTFTVTPTSDGTITVTIPAGSVTDQANNSITASNVLRVTFDRTTHVPALSTDAASPTNAASATVTVDFGEPINPATFDISDVSVSGGDASNLAQEGATTQRYTFTVTPTSDGTITVTIPAGSVTDQANNSITASNVLRVTFDRTTHVPALSTDAASPTNAASATVTVDFGEPINPATFDISDVSVSGGDASNLAQEGATTQQYTFTVTPTSDGTITVTIPAGSVTDQANNSITASNALQITFDRTTHVPALSTDAASPTNAASATVTVDFGEPINPATFDISDVSVSGGDASNLAQEGATTQRYTFTVTPTSDGTITVTIPAGSVTDQANNSITASNALQITFDRTTHVPALSTDAASPTNAASATVTVDFGEPINPATFDISDVSVSGGDASNLAQEGATTQQYTFTVTPTSDGTITVTIPAGSVTDQANNSITASNALQITFDRTTHVPALSTDAASPTNAASATVTVDFGEPINPATFDISDVSVSGGDASNLAQEGATTQRYTFTVTPTSDGTITVTIPAGSVTDQANNSITASNALQITFDRTTHVPALSTDADSPTNAASATVTVDFGEPINPATFDISDVSVSGGDASNLAQEGATTQQYTFTVTPTSDGTITVTIPAGSVTDQANNSITASNALQITFDRTTPGPALSTDAASPTNTASATVTVDFGEPINPATFDISDVSVSGGDASNLAQEGATTQRYTFTVTPASDGTITVTIPAGSVTDQANNSITASNALQITFDRTTHVPALSTDADSPTNAASATVTVDFGEPINPATFDISDVSVSGGDASNLAQEGATTQQYTFTVTPASDGTITVTIPAGSVTDQANNSITASNALQITFDRTTHVPALSTDAASPTNAASATVTVDFGEPINPATFDISDVSVSGGDASNLAQEGATTQQYTFTVTPASDGTITVTIPAGSVTDQANNSITASNALQITFDRTTHVPALSTDAASPTNAASATVTVDFGEPINPATFDISDVSVSGGDASNLAQEGATTQQYTFTVTPTSDGTITVTIPAGSVTDQANNSITASNALQITFDRTTPGPALSTDAASPTNAASATVTVDFGEPINPATFDISDVSVSGGDASNLAQEGATTQQYTFTVTPASDGTITVTIPAGSVTDQANNSITASNALQITFDRTTHVPALSTDAASPTNAASATVTVDFGEPINPATFDISDVSVSGGDASNLAQEGATTQRYTFTVTPASDGTITVTIPAGSVTDQANNSITASNALQITFDRTTHVPALSTDAASPTNAASATVTVDFGEPINPATFDISDVSVSGGDASNLAQEGATTQQYTFTVTPTSDGTITVTIPAGSVTDQANNSITASNALQITFDRTTPGPALSTDAASPTNAASATVTVDFGEPINPATFDISDVSVSGGDASNLAQEGATTQQYTFTVTPTSDGTITVTIPAGSVTDQANNSITASNALQITFDRTTHVPALSTDADSPTNAASATVTVDFGEPINPATFDISDVSVSGGDASNLAQEGATTQRYTFTVTPTSDGTITVTIPAGSVTDQANNSITASNALQITFDRTTPGPALSTDAASPTNAASATVTVDFGEPINPATFDISDVSVSGGDASNLAQEGATTQQYTFTVTPTSDGTITVTIPAGSVTDQANNSITASNALQITFDRTTPVPALSTDAASPTNAASATVTVDFGEPINPATFDISDVSVSGGDASNLAQEGATTQQYTFTVTPTSDGTITVTIPAGSVTDQANNSITASNALQITFDRTTPVPALSTDAASPTNAASATVTVDFGEPINPATFDISDVSVSGGDASNLAQEGATTQQYTFTVTPTSDGTITVTIPAGSVTDQANNSITASNALQITFDRTTHVPALSTDAASPTNAASATVTVDFGEPINPATFDISDVSVSGGDASNLAQEGATTQQYTFTVTPTSDGTITVTIPAGSVTDQANNSITASNALQITFDRTTPVPALSTDAASPTNAASATVTVDFGEPINPATFDISDVSVSGGDASNLAQEGATTQQYTFTVTPTSDGTITVTIPAGSVTDQANNSITASNALQITFDRTTHVPALSTDAASPTNAASATVTVDFGEPINPATFDISDVSVSGGDASNLAQEGATTQQYTFTVTPTSDGTITVTIPAGSVTDQANNSITASNALQITFDRTTHVPALSTDAASPTNAASATVTVDFGEPINPATFDISDVSVSGGDASNLAQEGATTQQYTFTVTPTSDGTITVTIPAGSVTDQANNSITASNALQITFDRTTPVPALSTDAASPTNAASATVTVDFGEPINPATFDISDVSVSGGDASNLAQEGATTQQYTFTVTPASDGTITVTIPAGSVTDQANNSITASNALQITFDRTTHVPALSTDAASPTNAASATVTVDFGEPINPATFDISDVSVSGGDASNLAQEGATTQQYTFTVTPASDGTITVTIPAGSVTDQANNSITASNALQITFDRTTPGPALSTDAASPTNAASATVTVDFGEPINPATFDISDVSVSGGDASNLAQEGATTQQYTFTVTPTSDGTITVTIPAGSVTDQANNSITASNALQITFDRTTHVPALSTDAASPTNAASATVTVDFGEPINPATFDISDVSVSGGDASNLAQEGATTQQYTFTVTPASDGTITVTIPAGSVTDQANNSITASNALQITFDRTTPGPALSTDAASPTNAASATVTVDFGEPINPATFDISDVSVSGGDASNLAQEGATTQQYTFTVTPASDGTITVTIPAGSVTDQANNSITASNALQITFDRTTHVPALSTDAASPTNAASATVTVDFGEPINPATFDISDVSVSGGDASNLAQEGATTQQYTFTVTPTSDGTITVTIPAGSVTDQANNSITASNALQITFDRTTHVPALSTDAASPTNAASATVTVDFGEPINPATFDISDVSVSGGDASNLAQEGATTQQYTFTVTPASDGTITVTIPAGSVTDQANNSITASNALQITFDRTTPGPALSTDAASPTNAASATVTVDFGEPINPATFDISDVSVSGGDASNLAQEGATTQQYTFTVTPTSDGTITVTIPAGSVTDQANNSITASNALQITFDRTTHVPALSTDAASPTNAASATVTVDFGEPINPATFDISDVSVSGGDASNLAQEGATTQQYTFTVTPASDGTITVTIPAGSVTDQANNSITASNALQITFDRTTPGPALSTDAASPTNAASATVTVDFGEPINPATFDISDVSVSGGDASNLAQEGATTQQYTFTVTPTSDGTITVTIPAGSVTDQANNSITASNALQITFDRTTPGPALSTDAASPTNAASATVTVDFGEPINPATFDISDVSVSGGDASNLAQEGATTQQYTFTVTPTSDGTITVTIPAGSVTDQANNSITASNALQITFDRTTHVPALSTDAASPTNAASATVTVDFGEPINPATFDISDVSVSGGDASNLAQEGATTQQYTFTVTPTSDGTITVTIPAGSVTDQANNSITASNALQITFDRTTPGPALSTDAASPTNAASATVTVDFGEPINPATFDISDVSVSGGDASNLAQEGATTQQYTFTVTPTSDGTITVTIPAGSVTDQANNSITASNALQITFDRTTPGPALSTDAASPTNAASATVTVDFGEPINPATFDISDVSVSGGDASNLAQEGATTQQYTFTVTPTSDGTITVTIPAGSVTDQANNSITASNALQITFDRTTHVPALSTDAASPTNAASATVTVDFGEPINPATFDISDVSVSGGDASNLAQEGATTQQYTFTVTPTSDGTITVTIPAGSVTDQANNSITASNALQITFDRTTPGPALSTDAASPTNAASATVTVDFGEPINPATFDISDVSVSGGTASNLAPSPANQTFTFTLTPGADGEVTAEILANRVMDIADNSNTVSNVLSVTFDRTAPVITVQGASPASIYAGQAYEDLGAACHDNLDGDLTGNVTATSNVDASAVGTYSVVYTCTDETGNTAQETRTVSVVNQPLQTDTGRLIWTVEDLVGMLGSEGRHNFAMIARCDDGTVLTGATLELHLGGLLTQIGANALETVDVPYKLVIDVERSWWDYPEYWSLASIITNTATAKIAYTLIDYGITLDEYIDAGPDAVFEYPKYNVTKEHLGGLDAYEVSIDWSGEGTCTVEWIRY